MSDPGLLILRLLQQPDTGDELADAVVHQLLGEVVVRSREVGERLVVAVHQEAAASGAGVTEFASRLRSRAVREGQVDYAAGWDGTVPALLLQLADRVQAAAPARPEPSKAYAGWHGPKQRTPRRVLTVDDPRLGKESL
jgi:hypothetical protein